MYGLKQAPLQWNKHLHNTLTRLGFKRNTYDPCIYQLQSQQGIIVLAVVVDDILVASSALSLINKFESDMKQVYQLTSLGVPKRLVGLNITMTEDGLTIDQEQFVKDIAADFKQSDCKPVSSPASLGDVPLGASPALPPNNRYLSLVGSLLWASLTRPDIAVAISLACSKSVHPTKADMAAAIRILRYLLHTPHVKLTFRRPADRTLRVCTYVDAAWSNASGCNSRFG